jgi:microcystin degradation protein MlrC
VKILIARFNHETNTFSPVPTTLADFNPLYGDQALRDQEHASTAMAAMIQAARSIPGAELVTPVCAMANPSGTVAAAAYTTLCQAILDQVPGCDAIMLDLHGALVAENAPDGEGELLEKIRALAPTTPIAVALDLHANVTQRMVDHSDILLSFKTYPHIDMYETGARAARLLLDHLSGERQPVTGWAQVPLLSHTLRSNTNEGAMQRAVRAAQAAEAEPGVLAVSILAGFSLADFADAGVSVVVVTDNDQALATQVSARIAKQIWQERDGFVYASEPLRESLLRAQAMAAGFAKGPVLLLDHSDNVMSGGTCDTMDVLQAALDMHLTGIAMGPLCDPLAVSQLWEAGVGAKVQLPVGNRTPLTRQGISKHPVSLSGVVKALHHGEFIVQGPIYTGSLMRMGRTVLFDIGPAQLVITEQRVEPYDLGVFTCVGIDPKDPTYLLLKSRMYCRPVFGPISRGLVECDSDLGGPTSSNYTLFPFQHIRQPVYPLQP